MLTAALLMVSTRQVGVEARLRVLEATVASDLPLLDYPMGKSSDEWADEAESLTRRSPHSARVWRVRALCEARAARFDAAVASTRRAWQLGLQNGAVFLKAEEARARVAHSPHGWGKALEVLDEGAGYWLIAVGTRGLDGKQFLIERRPGVGDVVIFRAHESNAGMLGMAIGLRRLDRDHRPKLVVESYTWLSNGGECELALLKGSRGHWRVVLQKPGMLWDVPIVDADHDGRYELGTRTWVWYKGPTWMDLNRLSGDHLVNVTREFPALVRRQARDVRQAVQENPRSYDDDHRVDARELLKRYGLRL